MLGLDYAGGRPGGAAITAAGYGFVVRYLSAGGLGLPGKLLTPAEYADLMVHGVAVVANWETYADRMKAGYQAGVRDAQRADAQVRAVGHPVDRPIYFSADWDASPTDQAEIDDYLRGAIAVLGADRVGVYGSYYVCRRCLDNHTARWAWQTGAWSGGQREPRAHLYQRIGHVTVNGVACDVNEALVDDFGQHPFHDQEDDMQPDERDALYDIREQMTGSRSSRPPQYAGWPAQPDLSDKPKTLLDYIRAMHAEVATLPQLRVELAALQAALPGLVAEEVRSAIAEGVLDVDITVANKTEEE